MEERFYKIITPIEIERRQNNLELHGLPEQNGEDCNTAVKAVLARVTAEPVTISKCFRFGKQQTPLGEKTTRKILIQFDSKSHRDLILRNRANLRKFNDPIYINENLPSYLNTLRGKANALKKLHNYKFLWIKNGNILIRKNENSPVINIKSPSDLDKIK